MKAIFLLSVLMFAYSCSTMKHSAKDSFAPNKVVAHRGAFKQNSFPENSIASLRETIRLNCTGSEFDVRMTSDDTLMINHDPHYNQLDIEKTSYQELSRTPLSNGETIPTLRQYLLAGLKDNKQTRLVVEIKPSASKERGQVIAEKVLTLVRELSAEQMVVYISFDYDILKKLKALDPKVSVQYLNGDRSPKQLKDDGMDGADYNISVFKKFPEWIPMAKENKIILNAWTVNNPDDMKWLLSQKFDFITTNEPELLLSL